MQPFELKGSIGIAQCRYLFTVFKFKLNGNWSWDWHAHALTSVVKKKYNEEMSKDPGLKHLLLSLSVWQTKGFNICIILTQISKDSKTNFCIFSILPSFRLTVQQHKSFVLKLSQSELTGKVMHRSDQNSRTSKTQHFRIPCARSLHCLYVALRSLL